MLLEAKIFASLGCHDDATPLSGDQPLTSSSEHADLLSFGPKVSHYMVPPFFLFGGKLCSRGNI